MLPEISIEIKDLIRCCILGERKCQEKLYKLYARKMYGVCLRYAKNKTEAEDLLQDGFIKVFNNINRFEHKGSFEGWVRRIMVNTCLEYYRRSIRIYPVVELENIPDEPSGENILNHIAADDLIGIIQQLPAGYRAVFNLYAIEGYSHKEIADSLGISESTSKSQLSRARVALQNSIKQMGGYNNEKSI